MDAYACTNTHIHTLGHTRTQMQAGTHACIHEHMCISAHECKQTDGKRSRGGEGEGEIVISSDSEPDEEAAGNSEGLQAQGGEGGERDAKKAKR